jgi:hypothetical protein
MGSNGGGLKYLEHKNIDYEKWDRCIENASNSRIYAMSWHLDRTAEKWDALVLGNYEVVMPLPHRTKWGIKYIYQPLFSQQLGIFPNPPDIISNQFYTEVTKKFRLSDLQINSQNYPNQKKNILAEFEPRINYLLDLSPDYSTISSSFSNNTKRNIKKACDNDLSFSRAVKIEEFLNLKNETILPEVEKKEINKLKSLVAYGQYRGFGAISGVYDNENNICAAVYFARWKNRIIYLNAVSNEQGKKLRAMFYLTDKFIEQTAGNNLVLDFEGSMLPGVARFYKGFGGVPETYYQFRFNQLPPIINWLKNKLG